MWDSILSGAKQLGSGIMQGELGTDFGLGGGPTVVGASAVKKAQPAKQANMQAPANPEGVGKYMTPSAQGPAISGPANEAMARKKRQAPGQVVGNFEKEVFGESGDAKALANMRGILDMPIDSQTPGLGEASKALDDEIESLEPIQQLEKDAKNAGADLEADSGFDLQAFGRLLSSVEGGRNFQGPKSAQMPGAYRGGGNYKSKGLWDQRIMKEWMDIYNKPTYTPLHKVAAMVR